MSVLRLVEGGPASGVPGGSESSPSSGSQLFLGSLLPEESRCNLSLVSFEKDVGWSFPGQFLIRGFCIGAAFDRFMPEKRPIS